MRHRGSAYAVTESPQFCGAVTIYTRDLKTTDPNSSHSPRSPMWGEGKAKLLVPERTSLQRDVPRLRGHSSEVNE